MSAKPPKVSLRHVSASAPPGYLVGRVGRGKQKGPLQLIPPAQFPVLGLATKAQVGNLKFTDLADTPKTYSGAALEFVQVNSGQTGLVFTVAVVPTGSPVSGNLTKFSGASSVTNGDLSGVVTTSGSLVTTAANPFQIGTAYVRTGAGAGPGTDPEGSLYLRTDNGLAYTQWLPSAANPARVQDKVTWNTYTGVLGSAPTPGNVVIAVGFGSSSPSVASGWTSILTGSDSGLAGGLNTLYRIVAYHYVQAGDSTSYTPFTGSGPYSVSLHECSGVDQADFNNSLASVQGQTSSDLGTASLSFTTTSNNNLAILSATGISDAGQQTTNIGGTTTWTNQSAATGAKIGSAAITTSGTVVNGTGTFSGGSSDRYTGLCMVVLNPPPASQDTGLQQLSYLTVLKNAGSSITSNARSINFSTGLSASDDGEGNTTVTATSTGTVTTTGSPASGNLAKFSGATSITNGDLSGDVTTSGTLATTIGNTKVTLAKIQNATANSKLLGSGSAGSGASYSEITLGSGLSMSGTTLSGTAASSTTPILTPGGRLTPTSGAPVLTASATAQTTVYYDSFVHAYVPVFDGVSTWNNLTITSDEISMGLDAVTPHVASGSLYDVFGLSNSGSLVIAIGPAWTSTTARGSGAGTTQLVRQNGILVNAVALTHAWGGASGTTDYGSVAATTATYLGTIYATANGKTGMGLNPAAANGGTNNILGVYNAYNRVPIEARCQDNTASWTHTGTTWGAADASNSNRISWIDGLQQSNAFANYLILATGASANSPCAGIGWDSTSTAPNASMQGQSGTGISTLTVFDMSLPLLGFHFVTAMEVSSNTGTDTFFGLQSTPTRQTMSLTLTVEM